MKDSSYAKIEFGFYGVGIGLSWKHENHTWNQCSIQEMFGSGLVPCHKREYGTHLFGKELVRDSERAYGTYSFGNEKSVIIPLYRQG